MCTLPAIKSKWSLWELLFLSPLTVFYLPVSLCLSFDVFLSFFLNLFQIKESHSNLGRLIKTCQHWKTHTFLGRLYLVADGSPSSHQVSCARKTRSFSLITLPKLLYSSSPRTILFLKLGTIFRPSFLHLPAAFDRCRHSQALPGSLCLASWTAFSARFLPTSLATSHSSVVSPSAWHPNHVHPRAQWSYLLLCIYIHFLRDLTQSGDFKYHPYTDESQVTSPTRTLTPRSACLLSHCHLNPLTAGCPIGLGELEIHLKLIHLSDLPHSPPSPTHLVPIASLRVSEAENLGSHS